MKSILVLVLSAVLTSCTTLSPSTSESRERYDQHVLSQISDFIQQRGSKEAKPVVVFDLDDTLFDARTRNLPIFKELAADQDFAATFPDAAKKLAALTLPDVHYDVRHTLKAVDIQDEAAIKRVSEFWAQEFFSHRCADDAPLPGAATLVNQYASKGAVIVYLSGRDVPRMQACSRQSLKAKGFPTGKKTTHLILKPDPKGNDLEFKRQAFEAIDKLGDVVAVFENEPRNLNAMGEHFPRAVLVFVDSRHSTAPDQPTSEAHWIRDFFPGAPPEN